MVLAGAWWAGGPTGGRLLHIERHDLRPEEGLEPPHADYDGQSVLL